MPRRNSRLRSVVVVLLVVLAAALPPAPILGVDPEQEAAQGEIFTPHEPGTPVGPLAPAAVPYLPAGFRNELLIGGLFEPSVVQFAANGKVFVAQKNGKILVYDSLSDPSPDLFADLQDEVHNWWDRGMLGMVLDPDFTTGQPYVYVLYAYNHAPDGSSWPSGTTYDSCPTPPGSNTDGCVISGRLARLTAGGNVMTSKVDLITDWCQQFGSHSVGNLAFGPEKALYATGGDGAYFFGTDYGQRGGTLPNTTDPLTERNPCGDPPGGVGGPMTPPTAEGGALRSQDFQTTTDPTGLNGTLIRIDPHAATGVAWPTNSAIGSPDLKRRMIIAYGLRNPFRFAIQPGGRVWIGDVGYSNWEEIDELPSPTAPATNFGWPCYEGSGPLSDYMGANLNLCTGLDTSEVRAPFLTYSHNANVVAGDPCGTGSSAIAGLAFLGTNSSYPDSFDRALFFSDYNRRCIWYMPADTAGRPISTELELFADLRLTGDAYGGAVYLTTSPQGDLVYADFAHGQIRRIRYYGVNVPPTAAFTATRGASTFDFDFDASGTTDPNPADPLTFAWALDNDGVFDDGSSQTVSKTYSTASPVDVTLRVTDGLGEFDTVTHRVYPGDLPPQVTMVEPSASIRWSVDQDIVVSATATDPDDGTLPPAAFLWTLSMEHCPSNCHSHTGIWSLPGAKSGSFPAPDHELPSHLKLTVTVTDSSGQTASVSRDLYPATGVIAARSDPPGLPLTLDETTGAPPPNTTRIVGSTVTASAPATGTLGVTQYTFDHWSDSGAAVHGVTTTSATQTLTAYYRATGPSTVYRPLNPARLLDTRIGTGLSGTFKANVARTFQVTGWGGVPAGAVAVTGNLTVTRQTGAGHVALTPTPNNAPTGSNLNFPLGVDRGSMVTATLGPGGKLSAVYVAAAGKTAHLVFDVTGYFTASGTSGTYKPLDPARVLDTRTGRGLSGRFVVGTRRSWQITGVGGVPAAAIAVTGNLAVTGPTAAGHVTLYPAGAPTTSTSTLNFKAGETAANGVAIRLGTGGRVSAGLSGPAGATTHLIFDVTGYFVNDATGARYIPLFPSRALDTRTGLGLSGAFAANSGRNLPIAGRLGIPAGAVAINGTLTATGASAAGHLSLMRIAANTSPTATLNFLAAESRANGFFGRMAIGGSVGILYVGPSGATTHVVLDLAGYFK